MKIKGMNFAKCKADSIESHNPLDKLITTKAGDIFNKFLYKEIGTIKNNTAYFGIDIAGLQAKNSVLSYLPDGLYRYFECKRDVVYGEYSAPEIIFDIEFFFFLNNEKVPFAFYSKEHNVLVASSFAKDRLPVTYYDFIADQLLYYNITGKIKKSDFVETESITVGIDGELEPVDKVRLWPFSCREIPEDQLGCVKLSVETEDPIGIDNGYGQIEIRPGYGSPEDVVTSVKNIMDEINNSKYHISTKGNRYPLGCHVHFGFGMPIRPTNELLYLLDYFIGRKMMVLSGRARGHFQQESAFRIKAHGFEYRSMPSAIMESPEILNIVLTICLAVVKSYNNENTIETNTSNNIALMSEYKQIGINENLIRTLNKFIKEYKELTYEINTVAAWTNEKREAE